LKHQNTAFLYVSQIIVRVQAIEDPHNQIIARVRTCGPSRDRRLCLSCYYNNFVSICTIGYQLDEH